MSKVKNSWSHLFLCRNHCVGVVCYTRVTQVTKTTSGEAAAAELLAAAQASAWAALFSRYTAASLRVLALSSARRHYQECRREVRWCEGHVMTLQGACVISICRCRSDPQLAHEGKLACALLAVTIHFLLFLLIILEDCVAIDRFEFSRSSSCQSDCIMQSFWSLQNDLWWEELSKKACLAWYESKQLEKTS